MCALVTGVQTCALPNYIDGSDERFDDFEEIRKEWVEKEDPGASGKDPNIEITYAFRAGLQIGDYVVISDGRDSFRALGRVTGEYYFDSSASVHRSEEHTSELQSLLRISYAVFCLKKQNHYTYITTPPTTTP